MTASRDDEFTEAAYRRLVAAARARGPFLSFREAAAAPAGVLWRHDIDVSVHRALALARIEHEEGARATYFVALHSPFYNALEAEIAGLLRAIAALGHEIGLHFDPHFHGADPGDAAARARLVAAEAALVATIAGVRPVAVSFHDPDLAGWDRVDDDDIAGLTSAYGRTVRERFHYCSDSNGYWRFARLADELARADRARLHVLTHPEWWVPEPLPPRARIARAVEGRAARVLAEYDRRLAEIGRENRR